MLDLICVLGIEIHIQSDIFEISWHYTRIRNTSSHLHKFSQAMKMGGCFYVAHCNFPSIFLGLIYALWLVSLLIYLGVGHSRPLITAMYYVEVYVCMYLCALCVFESFIHCSLTHFPTFVVLWFPRLDFPPAFPSAPFRFSPHTVQHWFMLNLCKLPSIPAARIRLFHTDSLLKIVYTKEKISKV